MSAVTVDADVTGLGADNVLVMANVLVQNASGSPQSVQVIGGWRTDASGVGDRTLLLTSMPDGDAIRLADFCIVARGTSTNGYTVDYGDTADVLIGVDVTVMEIVTVSGNPCCSPTPGS